MTRMLGWREATGSSPSSPQYDHLFKVIVVGDSGVGKSCLLLRFVDRKYRSDHSTTIGLDFGMKRVELEGGIRVKLHVWDCCGMETFLSVCVAYYRTASAVLLVYDVTDRRTFEHILWWCENVRKHSSREASLVLVGNKADLSARQVSHHEGEALANSLPAAFFETSAKDFVNVDEAFMAAATGALHAAQPFQASTTTLAWGKAEGGGCCRA